MIRKAPARAVEDAARSKIVRVAQKLIASGGDVSSPPTTPGPGAENAQRLAPRMFGADASSRAETRQLAAVSKREGDDRDLGYRALGNNCGQLEGAAGINLRCTASPNRLSRRGEMQDQRATDQF